MGQTDATDNVYASEPCAYQALPGFQYVNDGIGWLKDAIYDGQECSCSSAMAYLGFRVVSYTFIPLITNVLSLVLSILLTLATLPLRCCCEEINDWCWERLQGSGYHTAQSLWDLTCDIRQVTGFLFCCDADGAYRSI